MHRQFGRETMYGMVCKCVCFVTEHDGVDGLTPGYCECGWLLKPLPPQRPNLLANYGDFTATFLCRRRATLRPGQPDVCGCFNAILAVKPPRSTHANLRSEALFVDRRQWLLVRHVPSTGRLKGAEPV